MAKFKVGDRVRDKASDKCALVIEVIGRNIRVRWESNGVCGTWAASEFELAPLHIEAGKYYKTRDGRKVGPMKSVNYGIFVWESDDCYYDADGVAVHIEGDDDLISKWVDEPATAKRYSSCAAAQVDVQREEYGLPWTPWLDSRKFPVGSRVVRTNGHHPDIAGTVTDHISPYYNTVSWDNGWGDSAMWRDYELRLVAPTRSDNTPAIVALIEDAQPKPSEHPHVHPDRVSAEREAKRLAGKHPGKEFGVYELVVTSKEEKQYKHEWQRLAAGGSKFSAITNLRRLSGLNPEAAQLAVEDWLKREAA